MSSLRRLRELISERLSAAAEEIFTHVENIIVECEEEVDRQRKLLEIISKPRVRLQRIELPQQHVYNEQQFYNREWNSSLDQEEPESLRIKEEEVEFCASQEQEQLEQEADTFMLTSDNEESDHMEPDTDHQLLSAVAESQDQTVHKRNITELPLKDFLQEEEEVLTEQWLYNQERNSSLDQEEPESLQIKEEEEEICPSQGQEQLELKQKAGTLMLTPDNEKSDHMEPDTNHQLLSLMAERQEQTNITGEKPHMCDICKKCFTRKTNMVAHKMTHTGEKPYVCIICDKSFGRKINLKIHMRTHTGEKPYSCETCGKCFRQCSDLTKHKRIHTGEKPHICNICGRSFVLKRNLKSHIRTHRGEDVIYQYLLT